jgi:polyhydroxyalkanoate synthesis regulator phasin
MSRTQKLVVAGAALVAVSVAGGAIAATKALTPKQERQAIIQDAAGQLGVSPEKLNAALEQALKNRVDAAVKDGRLTKEQGARLKERIDAGEVPLFGLGRGRFDRDHHGFGFKPGFGHHGPFKAGLDSAAGYLGLTEAKLLEQLRDGKTLAQVAKAQGKSVNGLVNAMTKDAEAKLDKAVKSGRLTEAQKKEFLNGLKKRITDVVNGRFPAPGFHKFGRDGRDGPRPFAPSFQRS